MFQKTAVIMAIKALIAIAHADDTTFSYTVTPEQYTSYLHIQTYHDESFTLHIAATNPTITEATFHLGTNNIKSTWTQYPAQVTNQTITYTFTPENDTADFYRFAVVADTAIANGTIRLRLPSSRPLKPSTNSAPPYTGEGPPMPMSMKAPKLLKTASRQTISEEVTTCPICPKDLEFGPPCPIHWRLYWTPKTN